MKRAIQLITIFVVGLIILHACNETPQQTEKVEEASSDKSLNPNGDSELALLMRKMFNDANRIKKQIQNRESVTVKVNHNEILTAHATEPAKAASAEFKTWGAAYLAGLEELKNATPETAEASYTSLVNTCMNCHKAICPGPVMKIKKLKLS